MGTIESVAAGAGNGSQLECPICNENYDDHEHKMIVPPCHWKHVFCGRCVNEVLKDENPKCPYCRGDIKSLKPSPSPITSLRERMIKGLSSSIPVIAGACCATVAYTVADSGYIRSAAGGAIASVGVAMGYDVTTVDNPVIKISSYVIGWAGLIAGWTGLIASLGADFDSDEICCIYFSALLVSIYSIEIFKRCRRSLHDYMISTERPSP
ncbi:RING finger protein [Endozoicomonas euniceicola]|uniref:RING finger protein n=1 Tax=Endozoicomonas euniceicola TaxID=1234143 RepID=A0ABY6GQE2_9GAMM|nr:RING finger protein [Endozoicomonas euniceicola]UYM14965.1 RING finger protein [Endozoicomonas euniceicola]